MIKIKIKFKFKNNSSQYLVQNTVVYVYQLPAKYLIKWNKEQSLMMI
jgi:hypothetical protein